jgi:hypothetical protein
MLSSYKPGLPARVLPGSEICSESLQHVLDIQELEAIMKGREDGDDCTQLSQNVLNQTLPLR